MPYIEENKPESQQNLVFLIYEEKVLPLLLDFFWIIPNMDIDVDSMQVVKYLRENLAITRELYTFANDMTSHASRRPAHPGRSSSLYEL